MGLHRTPGSASAASHATQQRPDGFFTAKGPGVLFPLTTAGHDGRRRR